jgi:uncharacterized protein YbaR (Trm112 family)
MSSGGQGTPGKTRACPHCKATILESASICPVCRHHLRYDPHRARHTPPSFSALRVEGIVKRPITGEPWEYSLLLTIRNDRGEEITRQVIGVGALQPNEQRTFTLAVEVFTPAAKEEAVKAR